MPKQRGLGIPPTLFSLFHLPTVRYSAVNGRRAISLALLIARVRIL